MNISNSQDLQDKTWVGEVTRGYQLRLALAALVVAVVLFAGLFFRFTNIDKKFFWHDETYTPLRAAGFTGAEVIDRLFDGHEIGIQDIQQFLQLSPEKGPTDTIASLAAEDQEHPPLYFLLVRIWMGFFGNSSSALRMLSVLISLFVFPCIFWLCIELFGSRLVAWIAVGLVSISPFYVLYAQEARQYSLWTVMILLSSALLLRAMRLPGLMNWVLYMTAVILGLYTHLFFVLVVAAHGLYVLVIERLRPTRLIISYSIVTGISLLAFLPWIIVDITNYQRLVSTNSWAEAAVGFDYLWRYWVVNTGYSILDVDFGWDNPWTYLARVPVIILVGYSLYYLYRHTPKRTWFFVISLAGVTAGVFLAQDLFTGGVRSTVTRYLVPCIIGSQLAVAYTLSKLLGSASLLRKRIGQSVALAIVLAGIGSCVLSLQSTTWWTKVVSPELPLAAGAINQSDHPLVIVSNPWPTNLGDTFSLSYLLNSGVRFELVQDSFAPTIRDGFSDIFLYNPSETLWYQLETDQGYKIEEVVPNMLWRASK